MASASPFEFSSYKAFLKAYIARNRRKGIVSELARAAGCDRTYLSQVLGSKVNLTPDHGFGISEHLGMNEAEADYFLLLVLHGRASGKRAKKIIEAKLARRAREQIAVTEKIRSKEAPREPSSEERDFYYGSWKPAAVHIATAIQGLQSSAAIARRLSISEAEASAILEELVKMGLVRRSGNSFAHSGASLHLPKGGPHLALKHLHWRMKALESPVVTDSLHYTSVFAISRSDWAALKTQLLRYVEEQRSSIHSSGSEDVYAFCCDLYRVGEWERPI